MSKRIYGENRKANTEKQETAPRNQRLRFIFLRVLLFLACVAVSVGIWLTVHYAEHLRSEGDSLIPSADCVFDDTCRFL